MSIVKPDGSPAKAKKISMAGPSGFFSMPGAIEEISIKLYEDNSATIVFQSNVHGVRLAETHDVAPDYMLQILGEFRKHVPRAQEQILTAINDTAENEHSDVKGGDHGKN
jgi:hypothetical protein